MNHTSKNSQKKYLKSKEKLDKASEKTPDYLKKEDEVSDFICLRGM